MNHTSISIIHKKPTTYFKVKYCSILIVYYKSHVVGIKGVGNKKIICVTIIKIYWLIFSQIKLFV